MEFFKSFFYSKANALISILAIVASLILVINFQSPINIAGSFLCLNIALILINLLSQKESGKVYSQLKELPTSLPNNIIEELVPKLANVLSASESSVLTGAEQAYNYSATRYGVGYELLEIECFINEDGSATVKRKVTLMSFSEINKLDTYLLIPEKSPSGAPREIASGEIRSLTPKTSINKGELREEFGRLSVEIIISPSLSVGSSASYEMTERLPPRLYAVRSSREEIRSREAQYDYFGWNVNRPTRKLSLRVYFPGFPYPIKPDIYGAEVRYASASGFPANRIQHEEQKNLKGPILTEQGDRYYLDLEVEYPMIGLVYILRWQPIEEFEKTTPNETNTSSESENNYLSQIRDTLIKRYDEGELRTLIMDLGIDYEVIPNKDKSELARELVTYLNRRNRVQDLIRTANARRPDVIWPQKTS